jgi:hypothetical protein
MLAGFVGRPLGIDCIGGDPLGRLPFIFAVWPFVSLAPFSRPFNDRSEEVREGRLKLGCDCRSVESAAYGGIIWDSWMVTLIKEAVFPPGRCGEGVGEASFGACEVWLKDAVLLQ